VRVLFFLQLLVTLLTKYRPFIIIIIIIIIIVIISIIIIIIIVIISIIIVIISDSVGLDSRRYQIF
jgi:hypothetical protein